jgi:hypothetical protein
MKFNLLIGGFLAGGVAVGVVWFCFSNPLVNLLALVFWIASEAMLGWVSIRREEGSSNDPQTP